MMAFAPGAVRAQDATWLLNPTSGNYQDAANWNPATVPLGTAFFGASNTTALTFSAGGAVGGWTFNAGASTYTFANSKVFTFTGAGIVINGGGVSIASTDSLSFIGASTAGGATITNDDILNFSDTSTAGNSTISNATFGTINFSSNSTAGSAIITNNNNTFFEGNSAAGNATITNGHNIFFAGASTGGNAVITNNSGGLLQFSETSNAGNANITNSGEVDFLNSSTAGSATINNNSAGLLGFFNTATAGNANITNSGEVTFNTFSTAGSAIITNGVNGDLRFDNFSTAGSATINNSNTVSFNQDSTPGNAAITNNAGAVVDFSGTDGPARDDRLTAGSIAGAGLFQLGANELTVGGNNLSTDVSGVILGTGSLVKVGSGTLTLSGAATLGGTTVDGGTLAVSGGGTLNASDTITVGSTAGSSGTLNIGAGGAATTSNFVVGFSGTGTLVVQNGGTITDSGGYIGDLSGSQGAATVSGAGSMWTSTDTIEVGAAGTGTLIVENGGTVNSGGGGSVGVSAGSSGTVTVTGPGSTWNNTPGGGLNIGSFGVGTLTISNGGTVINNTAFAANIGNGAGSQGTVIVTGPGSTWSNSSGVNIGASGTGVLTIADGGVVTAAGVSIATNAGSVGTLNIGAAPGSPAAAPGTLTAASVAFGAGAGTLNFNHTSASYVFAPAISGAGAVNVLAGVTTLTAANTYTGGTTISGGALQLGNGGTSGSIVGNVTDNGALAFNRSDIVTFPGAISGGGSLAQLGPGATILTGANTYTGGTTISAGTLQLGGGAISGSIVGDVADNGALVFNRSDPVTFAGAISGSGSVSQVGSGVTVLTGNNSYGGPTTVSAGELFVAGDQSTATGPASVAAGATLGGVGVIGGNVSLANGATLAPGGMGGGIGTLTIDGSLGLNSGSILNYSFGHAAMVGGPFNDLTVVTGSLTLAGTLNVALTPGGAFDPGVYRVISYAGVLTDNGLSLGTVPPGTTEVVQTSVAHQVNLVNTTGVTVNYWDGAAAATRNNGVVDGGAGAWQASAGNDNWTNVTGALNAPWANGEFAIFEAAPGTVTVDNSLGQVVASGMQFGADGYTLTGGPITLVETEAGSGATIVRVGDGTAAGAGMTAIIASVLQGSTRLVKDDLGALILTGANTYSGGTTIGAGTLQLGAGGTTGRILGDVVDNGALVFDRSDTVTFAGVISGAGAVAQIGSGVTILTGDNPYAGGTTVSTGTLVVGDFAHPSAALSGGGPITVAAGATLGGYGAVTGSVVNKGVIAAGNATPGFGASPTGAFTIVGDLLNAGAVRLASGTSIGNVLEVRGAYQGVGGTLAINTFLGGDGSPSDRLVINGGAATGSTTVHVTNVGGPGVETTGNGIPVVNAINGATTAPGAFTLAFGELRAGAFDYDLFHGGANGANPSDWFLRSDFTVPPTGPPTESVPPIPPVETLPPKPPTEPLPPGVYPIIGPELATYGVVQPLARQMGATILGTLDDRVGDTYAPDCGGQARPDLLCRPSVWGHVIATSIDNRYSAFADPRADGNLTGVQFGVDLLRGSLFAGHSERAGLYGAYGETDAAVEGLVTNPQATAYTLTRTGNVHLDAWSGGAYWTHVAPAGWYLDAVVQGTSYSGSAGTGFASLSTDGWGILTSLEGGSPFALPQLGPGFVLEPQAQILWQEVSFQRRNDGLGDVDLGDTTGPTGRIGLRGRWTIVTQGNQVLQPYVRANLWRDWGAQANTAFGVDNVGLETSATRLQLGAGLTAKFDGNLSLFVSADHEFAVGDTNGDRRDSVRGTFGLRYAW
jgi:fibronectin-binding autotransporter adhesin